MLVQSYNCAPTRAYHSGSFVVLVEAIAHPPHQVGPQIEPCQKGQEAVKRLHDLLLLRECASTK